MSLQNTLQQVINLLRPHCSSLALQEQKTDLDKAFMLVAGLIVQEDINVYLKSLKAPLPSQVNSFGLLPDSPKSSSSQLAQDTDDYIR